MGAQQTAERVSARAKPDRSAGARRVGARFPLIVGLIGTVATIIAARGRYPGLGNDATSYLAIADHLAAGKGLGYFLEPKLGLWPPGWPALLALPKWAFGVNPQYTALFVNALMPIAIAFLAWAILRRLVNDRRLVMAGVLVAVLGPPTLSQTYFVQTEPTFIALSLLVIWATIRFADTKRWTFFALAVVGQWLSYMDRYVGLVLIGSVALWLVFDRSTPTLKARIRNGAVMFFAAVVVPAVWIVRNEIVVGAPFGGRDTPIATYKHNFVDAITSVGQYVHGYAEYQPLTGLGRLASLALLAGVGVGALVLLGNALASHRARTGGPRPAATTLAEMIGHPVGLLTIYALAHFCYMIYSASTIAFDPVNTRYLIPMFIPTLIVALVLVDRGATPAPGTSLRPGWLREVAFGAVAVFVVVQLGVSVVRVSASYWTDQAERYNSQIAVDIAHSPVFDKVPRDCRLMSNFPEYTYLAGVQAQRSPRITKFASSDRQHDLTDLERNVGAGKQECLIWVNEQASDIFFHPSYQYRLSTLAKHFDLRTVAKDDDVAVYRVEPRT
jgi:Dolichyl-phosphate-mannose-protein mannosyltransferase